MAGYDNASYGTACHPSNVLFECTALVNFGCRPLLGLPTSGSFPLLVAPTSNVLVAATQLSHCRSRRFAPTARWMALTKYVLDFVSGGKWTTVRLSEYVTRQVPPLFSFGFACALGSEYAIVDSFCHSLVFSR